jgi:hypothetical protein
MELFDDLILLCKENIGIYQKHIQLVLIHQKLIWNIFVLAELNIIK